MDEKDRRIEELEAQLERLTIGYAMVDDQYWVRSGDDTWYGATLVHGSMTVTYTGSSYNWDYAVPPVAGGVYEWVYGAAPTMFKAMAEATRILRERWAAVEAERDTKDLGQVPT